MVLVVMVKGSWLINELRAALLIDALNVLMRLNVCVKVSHNIQEKVCTRHLKRKEKRLNKKYI